MGIWEKIRRYLILWLVLLLVLVAAAVIVHWSAISSGLSGMIMARATYYLVIIFVFAILISLLRTLFR